MNVNIMMMVVKYFYYNFYGVILKYKKCSCCEKIYNNKNEIVLKISKNIKFAIFTCVKCSYQIYLDKK